MKRILLVAVILGFGLEGHAQSYGNEWIHYDRQYWSFKVWQDGIRRIDSIALADSGFPLATVDPRTIQLYARGRQVPIHVEGEQDGAFNTGDFIEFYGAKNDAWLDSALWDDPAHINNPYYSLYNDTIRYYLTWGPQAEALRTIESGSTNWAAYTPLPWCWDTTLITYPTTYQTGKRTPSGASLTMINEAEGYFFNQTIAADGADASRNYTLNVPQLYTGASPPASTYKLVLASLNNPGGNSCDDHHLQVEHAGTIHADTIFRGYALLKYEFEFAPSTVTGANTIVTARVVHDLVCPDLAPNYLDAFAPGWQSIRYPRTFVLGNGADLEIPGQTGTDSILMSFTSAAAPVVYAWAPNGVHRIQAAFPSGSPFQAVLPPSVQDMRVVVTRSADILAAGPLLPVNGTGLFPDPGLDLPDSAMVIVTHPTLMAAAMQYATYRETNLHNRYNTVVADVEQLYDQFGGGVRQHPLAIRNYLRYVYDHAPSKPQALFLVGKSVKAPATGGLAFDKGYRKDPLASAACLVPTMGWPSSDIMFGLNLSGSQPAYLSVPVGRLAARTPTQVLDYLAKVDSVESQPPAAWMKNILHFRGGNTAYERALFDAALNSFKVLAEDTSFSGNVTKFVKDGGAVIEQAAADSVSDMIEQGVTLMTFYAHAFGGGFDITIDVPTNYQWHGKFPTILGNSCYTGNLHLYDGVSSSEQFVLHENAGAVAFLSSVDVGLSNKLRDYSKDFYRSFSQVNYGKSIGTHMRFAALNQLSVGDIESLNNAETMTLHGDPTLIMNSPKLPDLEVTLADVSTVPQQVTADVDSFQVRVIFRNIGRGTHQSFSVALERSLVADGVLLPPLIQQVSMNAFQDTVFFTLPTTVAAGGVGINDLLVRLDLDPDLIAELDDMGNNQVTFRMSISTGDLLPVEPYNFAITSNPAPMLKASTGDPFAPPRTYIFQIDTTDLYNSPVMEQHSLVAPGGVVQWQPGSIYSLNSGQDSVVYFWRCTLDSAGQGGYNWHEFSFQHLAGRQGWGQSHIFQFKDDGFNLMEHARPTRSFEFFGGDHQIFCEVRGENFSQCYWRKDVEMMEGQGCGPFASLNVGVVDPFDFEPWLTRFNGVGRYYGNKNNEGACGRYRQERNFVFWYSTSAQMDSLASMLTNAIPDGHFVLVHTYLRLQKTPMVNSNAMAAMQALGATNLANGTVPDSVPYIFFCRKGDPSSIQEVWGDDATALIEMTANIHLSSRSGSIQAPRSHTALSWESLSWNMRPIQLEDSSRVQLSGVLQQGTEQPLLDLPGFSGDVDLQPLFTAQQYPQLRLKGLFWNDSLLAPRPAQLRRWQLLGVPAPECALDPPAGYFAHLDSVFQGQQGELMVAVRNIGEIPMDSLLMTAWVTDHNNQAHRVHYKYNPPLAVGAVLQDTIRFDTQQFPGPNSILIEANPVDTLTQQYDQPEQYHFNNIAVLRFLTIQDLENPVLDVTFDGMHILDGDIVSARPEIQVTLDDENQTLLLNEPGDTVFFKIFLTDPSGTMKRIYFREGNQEVLQFVPANGPNNVSKVFYRPNFEQDGKYRLTVRATDKSRNNSGDRDNSVNFEVINRPTITEVLNYPNPFTTSTRFVFTLTGREVPTAMRIQIMTISGRVVREVSMAELGHLHVGRNITDFAWDGTDQFGDRLARGVYLYRVMAQLHGQDIEYRDGGAGSYFKKGFGKMYLLR
ncbi:MAG: hypothetical protein K8H89_10390 [Flavobacteriales bacterium]|jgi:hypothetical protein|nr:hypothetical protein [Flavobacteriales bacterium]